MVRVGRALWFLLPTLRLDEALDEIKRAVALDPFSPAVRTAELWILYTMRKSDAADRARGINPNVPLTADLQVCRGTHFAASWLD